MPFYPKNLLTLPILFFADQVTKPGTSKRTVLSTYHNIPEELLSESGSIHVLICSHESTLVQEPGKDQLLSLLDPVKHEWRTIGEMLSIDYGDIQCEERNVQHNDTDKLSKVLQLWINQRKCEVSWKKIITVIKNPPLENVNLANKICNVLLVECNSSKKGIQLTYTFLIDITLYSFFMFYSSS